MDGVTLRVDEGQLLENAGLVESCVQNMETDMETLDRIFNSTAEGMRMDWADDLRDDWRNTFSNGVPEAMSGFLTQAQNLKQAVVTAISVSKGAGN